MTLALFAAEELTDALDERPPTGVGRDRVCIVLRVNDVEETATDLRTEDVDVVAGIPDHPEWGIRTIHALDPDGTLININEPLES